MQNEQPSAVVDIDLAPTAPALNARRIADLVERFVLDVGRRRQNQTANGYRSKLNYFLDWWSIAGPQRDYLLSAADLADYARHIDNSGLSYHTRNDALRRLRQMFRWAFLHGYVSIDLSADVPAASGSAPTKLPVELETLAALLSAAAESEDSIRNSAIVAMLAGTGARCEEVAAMQVERLTMYADGSGYVDLTRTKNDKPRIVAFDSATGEYIRKWLDTLDRRRGPLFPSRTGGRQVALTPSGIYKIVVGLAETAGVREQVRGPHDLRRMFATLWTRKLRGEGNGQLLQKQLGHASWATTQQYALQDYGDVIDVVRSAQVSPLAQLAASAERRSPCGLIRSLR